jgi:hypothetical protein
MSKLSTKIKEKVPKNKIAKPMKNPMIGKIEAEFLNEEGWKKTSPLDHDQIRAWMHSSDLEVLGATHQLLFDKEHVSRVVPPLTLDEIISFRKHYYGRCLREVSIDDDQWEWADWGFNAAHGTVFWFLDLWKDKSIPRPVLIEVKDWLAQLLKERVQQGLLATAVYDHLLNHKKIAKFFVDWNDEPQLRSILYLDTN